LACKRCKSDGPGDQLGGCTLNNLPQSPILPTTESFGHNLRQTHRLIQRDLTMRIARLDLTIGEWYALRALWESDGLTQTELASKAGVAGAAMVTAVRRLLALELVSRKRPTNDGRKFIISLTRKGWELEPAALAAAVEANGLALTGIPADEVAICLRVLRAALANLQGAAPPEPPDPFSHNQNTK